MTTRNLITLVLLWISVLSWSVYVGGTIYQMVVIDPIWNASPPESLRAFFKGTSFLQNILNFFGPRTMPLRYLPLLGVLFFGWDLPKHRPLFVIAAVCMTIALVFTWPISIPSMQFYSHKQVAITPQKRFAQWRTAGLLRTGHGCWWYRWAT